MFTATGAMIFAGDATTGRDVVERIRPATRGAAVTAVRIMLIPQFYADWLSRKVIQSIVMK